MNGYPFSIQRRFFSLNSTSVLLASLDFQVQQACYEFFGNPELLLFYVCYLVPQFFLPNMTHRMEIVYFCFAFAQLGNKKLEIDYCLSPENIFYFAAKNYQQHGVFDYNIFVSEKRNFMTVIVPTFIRFFCFFGICAMISSTQNSRISKRNRNVQCSEIFFGLHN